MATGNESKNGKILVVMRSFQTAMSNGKEVPFDKEAFLDKVAKSIKKIINYPLIEKIIVVTNGDKKSSLCEKYVGENETSTTQALKEAFPEEIANGKIISMICEDWGSNPGSGNALNMGIKFAEDAGIELVMFLSPEMDMNGEKLAIAISHMEETDLAVVGFARKRWWEKPQWNMVQNTAAIWKTKVLTDLGSFSPECNGTGETVLTQEFGDVPLAGMEDYHAILRAFKKDNLFRWGLSDRANTLFWDVNFPEGSERQLNHLKKVARQYLVMQAYAKKIFPDDNFEDIMDKLFSNYHLD